jgi:hypothetical protein
MDCMSMMAGSGWMMWGMGLLWVLVPIVLLLGVAALIKYLFFTRREASYG